MESGTTKTQDIAEISAALVGHVEFEEIKFSQILTTEHGQSQNDLLFVAKKFGVYFYTSRSSMDGLCYLTTTKLPTYVVGANSKRVFEIKK